MRWSKFEIDSKDRFGEITKVKMRAQIVVDVVPIFIAHVQSLLDQDNIRVIYARTSNFKMEPVTSMPLYFVAMP
jgi:hypothetical protein